MWQFPAKILGEQRTPAQVRGRNLPRQPKGGPATRGHPVSPRALAGWVGERQQQAGVTVTKHQVPL